MDIGSILIWIIIGALAGWIASMIMRTDAEQGALMNIVVGIAGAFIGGWLLSMMGADGERNFITNLLVAILGAVILLAIVKAFRRRSRPVA